MGRIVNHVSQCGKIFVRQAEEESQELGCRALKQPNHQTPIENGEKLQLSGSHSQRMAVQYAMTNPC